MIQSALISKLLTVHPRVYANAAPKAAAKMPFIIVDKTGSNRSRHFGSSNLQTGLVEAYFDIVVWGSTAEQAASIAESVIAAIENFSGPVVGLDSQAYSIADIEIEDEETEFDGRFEVYQYTMYLTVTYES